MITYYQAEGGHLVAGRGPSPDKAMSGAGRGPVWIDMLSPTETEEAAVEALLGFDIPTREEMEEIEISSRLYQEDEAVFLTALVLARLQDGTVANEPVTFVLARGVLVTIRYHEPKSFALFADLANRQPMHLVSGGAVLTALLEVVIDRLADTLEAERRRLDGLSGLIFRIDAGGTAQATESRHKGATDMSDVLNRIGTAEDVNGKVAESLRSIERILGFAMAAVPGLAPAFDKTDKARIKTMRQDLRSLNEYAVTQGQKVQFLLDASLGLINIRQAEIIKVFSVVAFVFLPPTLIASIYGMNFETMPELAWDWGYPAALTAMLVSAVVPYLLFKMKGWIK